MYANMDAIGSFPWPDQPPLVDSKEQNNDITPELSGGRVLFVYFTFSFNGRVKYRKIAPCILTHPQVLCFYGKFHGLMKNNHLTYNSLCDLVNSVI